MSTRFSKVTIKETKISTPCDAKLNNTTKTNIGKRSLRSNSILDT